MRSRPDLKAISDDKLLRGVFDVLRQTRHSEADLVAYVAEVDGRKLWARQAAPSMFTWCTEVLHLSEAEAHLRIAVAPASRRHPMRGEPCRLRGYGTPAGRRSGRTRLGSKRCVRIR